MCLFIYLLTALCCSVLRSIVSEVTTSVAKTAERVWRKQLLPRHRGPTDRARGSPDGHVDVRSGTTWTVLHRQSPGRSEQ